MKALRVRIPGGELAVRDHGGADRPYLIALHALGADHRMWDEQVDLFSRTHRLLLLDARGHGESAAPDAPYELEQLVCDVIAVMDAQGIARADILGLSMGGMTALGMGLAHPGRVNRLIVCDARADAPPAFRQGWDERSAAVRRGGIETVIEGTLGRWFTPDCPPNVVERARAMMRATSAEGYVGCAMALKELNYLPQLHAMSLPVLYLRGSEDGSAPAETMAEMVTRTPHSTLRTIPGAGHLPNMENPAAFAAAVSDWLRETATVAIAGDEP
jgi:3-oxoadipate enol-lactonase